MIIYFTGTGNSRYIANRLSNILQDDCMDLFEKIRAKDVDTIYSDKPFVVVAPTYAWQIPHILRDWLKKTKLTGNKDIYFVMNCGDGIGNSTPYIKKLCNIMGMNFKGCAEIVMPENYIIMFDAPETDEALTIVDKAESTIEKTASIILKGENIPQKSVNLIDILKSSFINVTFYWLMVHGKKFRVNHTCVGCEKCAKECVMNNITMVGGKPKWSDNCTHCMACICGCPVNAVEYGKNTIGKPRYQCPKK